jgi:hypothetical protein
VTASGIRQVLRRRGRQVGIDGLHPHLFRHTFAHTWRTQGDNETDRMRIAGWRPPPCCTAAAPQPPMLAPERRTVACPQRIDCRHAKFEFRRRLLRHPASR